jgi:pyridoxamine 5'-phosphate oxidase
LSRADNDPGLRIDDLDPDPTAQFHRWLRAAEGAGVALPEAMTLATASSSGRPSVRTVLLKGADADGFVFYTNYESRKGRELAENPHAAVVFYWHALGRQVRVEGTVTKLSEAESEAYFRTRPLGSRLGAWASPQSEVIADREPLEKRVGELEAEYAGGEVPLPPFWGGYRLQATTVEFWQHRADRLHDRFRYRRAGHAWTIERLAP